VTFANFSVDARGWICPFSANCRQFAIESFPTLSLCSEMVDQSKSVQLLVYKVTENIKKTRNHLKSQEIAMKSSRRIKKYTLFLFGKFSWSEAWATRHVHMYASMVRQVPAEE